MKAKEKLIANRMSEGILGYCHLEVEKNGGVVVVRLAKHRVLDQVTVNEISDELLGVAR